MNKINYQKMLDSKIECISSMNEKPSLLLHACCAPCSSYVLEYLSEYFLITVLFYNPNIYSEDEYNKRASELVRFCSEKKFCNKVDVIIKDYDPESFFKISEGLEDVKEGGIRCYKCYKLRLYETAKEAKSGGFDYFSTTLSISPMKNAEWLNEIGGILSDEYNVEYLYSDFKKKNGYKRSIELSAEYNLYRQDFCGCVYSKKARETKQSKGKNV